MTLRRKFQVYVLGMHAIALGLAAWWHEHLGAWFFLVEALIVASAIFGIRLVNKALQPLEFVKSFRDLLSEQEFATRFSTVGQLEMDQLIATYNTMLGELYEERLRLGEQRGFLERFMQVTPVGVVISDFDHRISLANPAAARFLGVSEKDLEGKTFGELDSELACRIRELDTDGMDLVQWRGARRLRVQRQTFPDRGFDREFVLIEELTALLNESERSAYEKLIRMMSHEVNNTIASTNSLLESCRTYTPQIGAADQADFLNALNVVITRNEHLNHFMRSFAEVVKLPRPDLQPTQLGDLLKPLEIMFQAQCEAAGIRWHTNVERDFPRILMDRNLMEQALINVVKNAIEAIGFNGDLEIRARRKDQGVLLEILDTGHGIDPGTRDELFTPFFSSKAKGQGLGLTLVKEILLRHGFDFGLDQAADGRTCFSIVLRKQHLRTGATRPAA